MTSAFSSSLFTFSEKMILDLGILTSLLFEIDALTSIQIEIGRVIDSFCAILSPSDLTCCIAESQSDDSTRSTF